MVVDIVVPRVDGALEHQIPDCRAQRRAAPLRHNPVALRHDQGGGHKRAADQLNCGHAIAKERAHRSPPIQIPGQGLERVERSDQDQPRNSPVPGEIGGDRSADAEPQRNHALAGLGS